MTDILLLLLEESTTIPSSVLETLVAQFLPSNATSSPSSFRMVSDVCSPVADKLQRHVAQYFAELISSAMEGMERNEGDGDEEMEKDVLTAHSLIKSIAGSCPALLLNVIPQMEAELIHEHNPLRSLATQTLGELWGMEEKGAGLVAMWKGTWKAWLGRTRDRDVGIRVKVVEGMGEVWKRWAELGGEIQGQSELEVKCCG
jgi:sister chromatid cohesion protein PDS5